MFVLMPRPITLASTASAHTRCRTLSLSRNRFRSLDSPIGITSGCTISKGRSCRTASKPSRALKCRFIQNGDSSTVPQTKRLSIVCSQPARPPTGERFMPFMNDIASIRWSDVQILSLRPPKNRVEPEKPYAFLVEPERACDGEVDDTAVVFLTNRECPFRCLMCDLWKNTLDKRVPDGSIAAQIEYALARMPSTRHIKLYNAGNFFDAQAIPLADWPDIADLLRSFQTVVVESHPLLIGPKCLEFRELLLSHSSVSK